MTAARNVNWMYVGGLAIAFLVGLIPGWYMAHSAAGERDQAREKMSYYGMIDESSAAALYATRGEYETARQAASRLFTDLRSAADSPDRLNVTERDAVGSLLQQRDDVITLLARNDAAARDRLFTIEYRLRQAFKDRL